MIRGLEFAGFVALAAAVHAGVWAAAPEGGGAGGQGGAETVTLAAAAPRMAALVAAWERPVAVQHMAPAPQPAPLPDPRPVALRPDTAPMPPAHPAALPDSAPVPDARRIDRTPRPAPALSDRAPTLAAPQTTDAAPPAPSRVPQPPRATPSETPRAPEIAALPEIDHRPSPALAALPADTRPKARPAAQPAAKPAQPSPARLKETARGEGGQPAGGSAEQSPPAQLDAATRASLMGQWGGAIRARIERQKRYPAGTHAQGTTHLVLDVGGDGRLVAVAVTRSSGDPRLDAEALNAVRRARLPAKPDRLPGQRHRFTLAVAFSR